MGEQYHIVFSIYLNFHSQHLLYITGLERDCADIYTRSSGSKLNDSIYTIFPTLDGNEPVKVFCNMQFRGGGWTVRLSNTYHNLLYAEQEFFFFFFFFFSFLFLFFFFFLFFYFFLFFMPTHR